MNRLVRIWIKHWMNYYDVNIENHDIIILQNIEISKLSHNPRIFENYDKWYTEFQIKSFNSFMLCKSMDQFLFDRDLRHERVNRAIKNSYEDRYPRKVGQLALNSLSFDRLNLSRENNNWNKRHQGFKKKKAIF